MLDLASNWARLAPGRTNLGLFNIRAITRPTRDFCPDRDFCPIRDFCPTRDLTFFCPSRDGRFIDLRPRVGTYGGEQWVQ